MTPIYQLAARFANRLAHHVGQETLQEIDTANASTDPICCASHEYCDANVPMSEAFEAIVGRPINLQPYQFGEDASKRTCLWLSGLPQLTIDPEAYCPPRMVCPLCKGTQPFLCATDNDGNDVCGNLDCEATKPMLRRWANQTHSGQNKLPPSADRWKQRSKTYPGIARALATQLSTYLTGHRS